VCHIASITGVNDGHARGPPGEGVAQGMGRVAKAGSGPAANVAMSAIGQRVECAVQPLREPSGPRSCTCT
jgi:hypothetical protein